MGMARLPINSLSGGVGRQVPTKRLVTEAENIDNCLVTLEKSIEKRPPLNRIACNSSSYLVEQNVLPVNITGSDAFNQDNLYFHFLDIDGFNRYCIVINRAAYSHEPSLKNTNPLQNGTTSEWLGLNDFVSVFRIEPTEWIQEKVDSSFFTTEETEFTDSLGQKQLSSSYGFNRGIFEYLTYGNKVGNSPLSEIAYPIAGKVEKPIKATTIKETFGSIDYGLGIILWNKNVPLDFLPDNASQDLSITQGQTWFSDFVNDDYIHSGDKINYKTADGKKANTNQNNEDDWTIVDTFWPNVRDDVEYTINPDTLEEEELGQNLNSFVEIPQFPIEEIVSDLNDANGFKASRTLFHYYDFPRTIKPNIDWTKDRGYLTSPLPKTNRLNENYSQTSIGNGKVYYARTPYLTFPIGFYRITRSLKSPLLERIRTEEEKSVFDHRRFPLHIFKATVTNSDGTTDTFWQVRHLPLQPRKNGTPDTNPGPGGVVKKEAIKSMAFWKNRLWVATDNSIFASRTNNFFNFWISDIQNIVDTDPIDFETNIGSNSKLSHLVPFQEILFVSTSGSTQFEIKGGSLDTGISPFNVEFRPTSFFSTAKLETPHRMGNNIFFADSGKMFMYLGGGSYNNEFSASREMSTHCRGYLPEDIQSSTVSTATNSILFTDKNKPNEIYFYTLRVNSDSIIQNAFYRWIISTDDEILALKAYEKDLYVVSKRPSGSGTSKVLVAYFVSLETVPIETPYLDWLYKVNVSDMVYDSSLQRTILKLPYYDPKINYVVYAPDDNGWGTEAYTALEVQSNQIYTTQVVEPVGSTSSKKYISNVSMPGNLTKGPVYVGRSYEMNVELSQQVRRSEDGTTVYEGVLNLKRLTLKHYLTGSYDVEIKRQNRENSKTTFIPLDINSMLTRTDQLKIETTGEHYCKVLSYSESCKVLIKSSYPTPCNIANIELIGTFRSRNTSIE